MKTDRPGVLIVVAAFVLTVISAITIARGYATWLDVVVLVGALAFLGYGTFRVIAEARK